MEGYETTIGHVHLKVRDLDSSVAFYRKVLGLQVTERVGSAFAFLSGSDAHHELALQGVDAVATSPPPGAVGLYHTAWEVPDARAFALAYRRLVDSGVPVEAVDHGISWALYFQDLDGNGVEIYLDRRQEPSGSAEWRGKTRRLSPREFAAGH